MDYVLISGLWLTPDVWDDTIDGLSRAGHRAEAVSLPASRGAVLDDQLAAVLHSIDEMSQAPIVVGHSAAATLAWLAADRRPDGVAATVLVGGFPATDGTAYADFFPLTDGVMGFPGWSAFEGPDSADLSDESKDALAARAVPVPGGVSQASVHYTSEARFHVPVTLICPEFSPDDVRGWIGSGDLPELANATTLTFTDIDTGHWPMISAPERLAAALTTVAGTNH